MTAKEILIAALDQGWDTEGWHAPLTSAVGGLTASVAARQVLPGALTARQLTQHVAFWKEESLRQLQGLTRRPEADDNVGTFGPPGEADDATGWRALTGRLEAAHARLREHLTSLPDAAFEEPSLASTVSGLAAHDSYHGAEIIQLRKLQGAWPA